MKAAAPGKPAWEMSKRGDTDSSNASLMKGTNRALLEQILYQSALRDVIKNDISVNHTETPLMICM